MSTIKSSTTLTTAYSVTADTTGTLVFQTGATPTTALTIDASQAVTFAGAVSLSGNQTLTGNLTVNGNTTLGDASTDTILMTAAPSIGGAGLGMGMGFRNRIINGAMVIDQRNAGASIAVTGYPVDRFLVDISGTGVLTSQRSTDAPAGFTNSLLTTVTTIDSSIGAAEYYQIVQPVEGFNVADFNLGLANASAFVVSFWVKASQTGTYPVQLANSNGNRCYPTTITVNASATWEYKTISVPATTAGTFNTTNGQGLTLRIGIVYGSNFNGATTNAWANFTAFASSFPTTTNNMMATLNATLQITGVQLEKGSTATSFDYRPLGTELALCQRYFVSFGGNSAYEKFGTGMAYSTTSAIVSVNLPVQMRSNPTVLSAATLGMYTTGASINTATVAIDASSTLTPALGVTSTGLTAGQGAILLANNSTSARVQYSAEL